MFERKMARSLWGFSDRELATMLQAGLLYEVDGWLMPSVSGEAAVPIWRLSGGAANADPNASLGGIMSTSTVAGATIFDDVSGDEAASGDTEYRGVYILNNGTVDLQSAKLWIQSNTPDTDTAVQMALAGAGSNATMATIANESTAPADGASFSSASSFGTGLNVGTLAAGQRYGVWIKRIVNVGAAAFNNDTFTLRVQGDTAA
jgi:hypothetical protein